MSISAFFKKLQAPLVNVQWSWGGVGVNNDQVLRVWARELIKLNGKQYMFIDFEEGETAYPKNQIRGARERGRQLQAIKDGALGVFVICHAHDWNADSWSIKDWNAKTVFIGSSLVTVDGSVYCELAQRVDVKDYNNGLY